MSGGADSANYTVEKITTVQHRANKRKSAVEHRSFGVLISSRLMPAQGLVTVDKNVPCDSCK